jgi:peptide chain release factor 3
MSLTDQPLKRITFAIISHPDAGKTTLTEKLLLYSGIIQIAGEVKARKSKAYATSDWMELEKQRGISVSTSVMQFTYRNHVINLLDTPGHGDFSEDTYRTLTAVDAALVVIDGAKGVEARTIKLFEVCRNRGIPIITFVNKMDREAINPIDIIDQIEKTLHIDCHPFTWPVGMGKAFRGIYHLYENKTYLFAEAKGDRVQACDEIAGIDSPQLTALLDDDHLLLQNEIALIKGTSAPFNHELYIKGKVSPVYFGSAINNFGIKNLLDDFVNFAPDLPTRQTDQRDVRSDEEKFTGFVFKIQANMDPSHRDRIAFIRICSGKFQKGMRLYHVRMNRYIKINQALTFIASDREQVGDAYPGDIIGIHNHGTMMIGDTFTEGESIKFTGIPHFAPEIFRRVQLKDSMKQKNLIKGLRQLSEEGATQIIYPLQSNDLILGAVGALQFDVVAFRLKHEYNVECHYELLPYITARWIKCDNQERLNEFKKANSEVLATDIYQNLIYLVTSMYLFKLIREKWPAIEFTDTQEI